jgi:hypothetical protein
LKTLQDRLDFTLILQGLFLDLVGISYEFIF